jgi:hypothetical protein
MLKGFDNFYLPTILRSLKELVIENKKAYAPKEGIFLTLIRKPDALQHSHGENHKTYVYQ